MGRPKSMKEVVRELITGTVGGTCRYVPIAGVMRHSLFLRYLYFGALCSHIQATDEYW